MKSPRLWTVALMLAFVVPAFSGAYAETVTHRVEIKRLKFEPETLAVRPGDTIVWVNLDIVPHTVSALDSSWDSGNLGYEEQWTTVVSSSMSGSYFCKYHPAMKGMLNLEIVQSPESTPGVTSVAETMSY